MPAPVIDYIECLKDSPRFRQQLGLNEQSLDDLEIRMEKLLKSCNTMTEGGRGYIGQQASFLASLWELSSYFSSDQENNTTMYLNKLIQTLQEILKFQNVIIDQTSRSITKSLSKFLKEDVKKMRETKGYFNKISNDLDSALNKNAAVSKSRPAELEDASNLLTATRSCFRYTGMDYVFQISLLQSKKKHVVLDSLGNLISAYSTFFHQGADLFRDMDPFMKTLGADIQTMEAASASLEKSLEKRHTYATKEDTLVLAEAKGGRPVNLEGYLFKRGQNAFRTWNRRWFYLDANKLCYVKRNGEEITVMEDDLRICMVRPLNEIDRRFCFEVISPTKSHVLQADSDNLYRLWLSSLQQRISMAIQSMEPEDSVNSSGQMSWEDSDTEEAQDNKARNRNPTQRSALQQILNIPGNQVCCDCSHPDPHWASINYGVTLCIECGGIHRSLGVHITKVRGIKLDAWEPEILKVMAELGNSIVNQILERRTGDHVKPGPEATRAQREVWIQLKYKEKAFVDREVFKAGLSSDGGAVLTVNRLRRRTRLTRRRAEKGVQKEEVILEEGSAKEEEDEEEKDVDTCEKDELSLLESVLRASTLTPSASTLSSSASTLSNSEKDGGQEGAAGLRKVVNAEVILFGGSLGKHNVACVELDSDQESTDGESESSWVPPQDSLSSLTPDLLLYRAARAHNLPVMLEALALGASTEWCHSGEGMRAPIHQAVLSGSVMSTQFLILNSAKTAAADGEGNTALHIAALNGNTGQVCLLLKHRADHHLVNNSCRKPLDIAVANSDADIVTLLRLAELNEEIRENDLGGTDDMFNDVVGEFSQMVYTHPERLNRNKK